ncbi:CLUMA_CG001112, isoform A [Clunio marinus]|uniref:CLUMA_CG001112, isoform A n=1 Tax=Clunio marinus TaxID=568069 RepID=A0A1J1HH30_9DIPT|nr:CLUMA_CG001112, isoform A [Clunio marinus]
MRIADISIKIGIVSWHLLTTFLLKQAIQNSWQCVETYLRFILGKMHKRNDAPCRGPFFDSFAVGE